MYGVRLGEKWLCITLIFIGTLTFYHLKYHLLLVKIYLWLFSMCFLFWRFFWRRWSGCFNKLVISFRQKINELVSQLGNQSTNRLFIIPSVIQSLSACQPTDHFIQLKDDQSVIQTVSPYRKPVSHPTSQSISQLISQSNSQSVNQSVRQSAIKPNNQSAI